MRFAVAEEAAALRDASDALLRARVTAALIRSAWEGPQADAAGAPGVAPGQTPRGLRGSPAGQTPRGLRGSPPGQTPCMTCGVAWRTSG